MNKREVELLFRFFMQDILLIPEEDIKLKMNEAVKIMKDIDINDSPILACALAVTNCLFTEKEKKSFSKMDKYPKQCESSNVSFEFSPVGQS